MRKQRTALTLLPRACPSPLQVDPADSNPERDRNRATAECHLSADEKGIFRDEWRDDIEAAFAGAGDTMMG